MPLPKISTANQVVIAAVIVAALVAALSWSSRQPPTPQAIDEPSVASQSANPTATVTPTTVAPTPSSTAPPASATAPPQSGLPLADLLAMLSVASEHRLGYDRTLFVHWIDADGDGCDTRREVLIAEATVAPTMGPPCSLSGGSWYSIYDELAFTDPSDLDIDHMVALAEAWDSGAFGWDPDRRQRFANDLEVEWSLIAVSASSNRSKSDQDPAEWLPPATSARCDYLADWIAVKVRWSLAVDQTERSSLEGLIGACRDSRRPVVTAP